MCRGDAGTSVVGMAYSASTPTSIDPDTRTSPPRRPPVLGLPLLAIIGLALLGAPRVVLHDLGLIHEGTGLNMIFVTVPAVIWIVVVLWRRVRNPFLTMLSIGGAYGIILVLVHQILWNTAHGGSSPRLGGNLSDLDPAAQEIIVRAFSAGSGLLTGLVVGALLGLVTWGLSALLRLFQKPAPE